MGSLHDGLPLPREDRTTTQTGASQGGLWTYERDSYSPSKTLRAEMGFSFRPAGCGTRVEECRDESYNIKINGSPRRCGKDRRKTGHGESATVGSLTAAVAVTIETTMAARPDVRRAPYENRPRETGADFFESGSVLKIQDRVSALEPPYEPERSPPPPQSEIPARP